MDIKKGKIGNALESVAPDHVVAEAKDIYDNTAGKYQTEINADKQDKLVSGTNIKTINNQSILGSGNISISGGGAVTGVKGSSESTFRTGDVEITAANIGLGNVGNFKAVSTVASQGLSATEKSNARTNIGAGTSSFSGSYNDLTNKPTIPAEQIQSDWDQANASSKDYIKNKPDLSQKANLSDLQALDDEVGDRLDAQDARIAQYNGNEVIVVTDHTAVQSPNTQKIYRQYGTDSYTDWMCTNATATPPTWQALATYSFPGVENTPTRNSTKLVSSGGLYSSFNSLRGYVDEALLGNYRQVNVTAISGRVFKATFLLAVAEGETLTFNVSADDGVFTPNVMNLYNGDTGSMLTQFNIGTNYVYTVSASMDSFYLERASASANGEVAISVSKGSGEKGLEDKVDTLSSAVRDMELDIYGSSSDAPEVMLGILNWDGKWSNVSQGYETTFYKVDAGDSVYVSSGQNTRTFFGYLASKETPVKGASIPYAPGCSRITVEANAEAYSGTVPGGCSYLAVLTKYDGHSSYAPVTLLINGDNPSSGNVNSGLMSSIYPKCVVEYVADTKFKVYQQDENNKSVYYMLEMNHVIDNSEIVYLNTWRIASVGGVYKYNGTSFSQLGNLRLLASPENEFAMKFVGKADFTGGYHGDERIDTSGSFAKFFVDGVELTSSEMSSGFVRSCTSFYALIKSTLHDTSTDGSTPVSGHPIVGYHSKKTEFCNQGYKVTNRVDFDFTAASYSSIAVSQWFTGLCCVSKDCAEKFYAENYDIHTAKNDGSQVLFGNMLGSAINFWSTTNKFSCEVRSKTFTENDNNCNLTVWDRAIPGDTDEKYYRYAPTRTLTTGDVYKAEMEVKWQYRSEG